MQASNVIKNQQHAPPRGGAYEAASSHQDKCSAKTERSLQKPNGAGQIIIIIFDDNEGQKIATKHASSGKVPLKTSKNAKQSVKAAKDSNSSKDATSELIGTKDSSSQHSSETLRSDYSIPESFPLGYIISGPLDNTM